MTSVTLIHWLSIFPLLVPNNNWEIDWNIFIQHKVLLWQVSYPWTGGTRWKDGSKTIEILFHLLGVEEWGLSVTSFGMLGAPHAIMRALFCELRKLELSGAFLRTVSLTNFFSERDFFYQGLCQVKLSQEKNCFEVNLSSESLLRNLFLWVYALIYIVYHFL